MNYLAKRFEASQKHQDAIWARGINELNVVKVDGKQIVLSDDRVMTEFMSCSYLGLDQRSELRAAAHATIDDLGVQMSAARTRMQAALFLELDELLTLINDGWSPVTFNSVSAAHMATIPVLASGKLPGYTIGPGGPVFIIDQSAHASLQAMRGIMEQFGKTVRVDFQELDSVAAACKEHSKDGQTVITLCDSIGSMGGSVDINAITALVDAVGGVAYFDDAHGTSIFGEKGEGFVLSSAKGSLPSRTIWTGSLSKAFGGTGGFVSLASVDATSFIKRYSMPYAFGGPPSLPAVGATVASAHLHLGGVVRTLQAALHKNVALFDSALTVESINAGTTSPIRGITIHDELFAITVSELLQKRGYAVTTAMYPTVKLGEAMIRVAISASHSEKDIRGLAEAINSIIADREKGNL